MNLYMKIFKMQALVKFKELSPSNHPKQFIEDHLKWPSNEPLYENF